MDTKILLPEAFCEDEVIGFIARRYKTTPCISGVEADAKRLVPEGDYLSPSLWIRSSQTSNAASMISDWLKAIGYESLAGIDDVVTDKAELLDIYTLTGHHMTDANSVSKGIYIVRYISNGKVTSQKIVI